MEDYIDVYSLALDDIFKEEGSNAEYKVIGFDKSPCKDFPLVLAQNIITGEVISFGYKQGYSFYIPKITLC